MTLTLTTEHVVTDDELKQAIALICSPVFGALNIANAFAGYQSNEWRLIRETELLSKLFREALERKLDLSKLECAVEGGLVTERPIFQQFMKSASEEVAKREGKCGQELL
jgi:hypothetical protein